MTTTATTPIDNFADMLDSRDIIARIEWLQEDRETHADSIAAASEYAEESPEYDALMTTGRADWDATHPDAEELYALTALAKECEGVRDWEDGAEVIRASYFTEYVQDMLESCGDVPRDLSPCIHIDWDATARDFALCDYYSVEFGDVSYWVRS